DGVSCIRPRQIPRATDHFITLAELLQNSSHELRKLLEPARTQGYAMPFQVAKMSFLWPWNGMCKHQRDAHCQCFGGRQTARLGNQHVGNGHQLRDIVSPPQNMQVESDSSAQRFDARLHSTVPTCHGHYLERQATELEAANDSVETCGPHASGHDQHHRGSFRKTQTLQD